MQILKRIPYYGCLALLAYLPFHIFLSQSLSLFTGGLEVWKIWKDVLLFGLSLFTICLVFWQGKATKGFRWLVVGTCLYGLLHLILWLAHPDIYARSAILGVIYNMRLPLYALNGLGAALLLGHKFVFSSVFKLVLVVSTIVAFLGVVQFFLPGDTLSHFGYGLDRGARAAFYIDDNTALPPRIMSTLREPNALGAYLILPAVLLGLLAVRTTDKNKRLFFMGAFSLHGLAVLLTFSRSAWAALFVALICAAAWQYREQLKKHWRRYLPVAVVLVVVIGASLTAIRHTSFFQSYIVHSNQSERVADLDSNDYHALFIKQGLQGIKDQPLGHGPGTAGLASIQNPKGSFLTENYYVQIGYEIGLIGLALFVLLNVWFYLRLRAKRTLWATVLLASFWAYVLMNMLLHTWSNEAVAAQWWLLAGMALALGDDKVLTPRAGR